MRDSAARRDIKATPYGELVTEHIAASPPAGGRVPPDLANAQAPGRACGSGAGWTNSGRRRPREGRGVAGIGCRDQKGFQVGIGVSFR